MQVSIDNFLPVNGVGHRLTHPYIPCRPVCHPGALESVDAYGRQSDFLQAVTLVSQLDYPVRGHKNEIDLVPLEHGNPGGLFRHLIIHKRLEIGWPVPVVQIRLEFNAGFRNQLDVFPGSGPNWIFEKGIKSNFLDILAG